MLRSEEHAPATKPRLQPFAVATDITLSSPRSKLAIAVCESPTSAANSRVVILRAARPIRSCSGVIF